MVKKYILIFLAFVLGSCKTTPVGPYLQSGTTTIQYSLSNDAYVKLIIVNSYNTTVRTLVDKQQTYGNYSVAFQMNGLPQGLYFYILSIDGHQTTRSLLLISQQ